MKLGGCTNLFTLFLEFRIQNREVCTETSPILGGTDFYLQCILVLSDLELISSERLSLQVLTKIVSQGVTSSRKLTTRTGCGAGGTHIIMMDNAEQSVDFFSKTQCNKFLRF